MTNLAINLKEAAEQFPDRPALRLNETVLTYADFDDRTARVAGGLRGRGLVPGDRVAVMLPNILAFPIAYYGALRAGLTVVPMNPLLKAREIEHYLADSGAKLAFVFDPAAEEARKAAVPLGVEVIATSDETLAEFALWPPDREVTLRTDDATAIILYTSGTTGTPKGAELTHANMRANSAITADTLLGVGNEDVIMGCLPLFHAFGQTCGLNVAVYSGATLTLVPRFTPEAVLQLIEAHGVTIFEGVPTMYGALLQAGAGVADTATLRAAISGGAALPESLLEAFMEVFGVAILEGYGLSETSPVASFNRADTSRPGSIGTPIEGVEMKLVDEAGAEVAGGLVGEIVIRGHNIMAGYWNRPEATAEAIQRGWFHTGDMGKVDADGFFYVVDRKKELIIRGGFNVYPREIEEVLYQHPAVLEAAVIGVPHPTHGEEVAAAVSLRPDVDATPEDLVAYAKERVAAYKYPRLVWILPELPKGPTGKIQKRDIVPPENTHV